VSKASKAFLTGLFWTVLLTLIGTLAYQAGQYHRLTLSLQGIGAESIFGILWKAIIGGVLLSWWFNGGQRMLISKSAKSRHK